MKLVIVESPTKAKTISGFLGPSYSVSSSMGHVRDLPKSRLGVDVEHDFEPKYLTPTRAKKVIKELKELSKNADQVILATDEDREGEAIAWHLKEVLKLKDDSTERIVFHEITKSAINKALDNPRPIDMQLVDAQQARRILDRLVGYELSPFLWKKVRFGLSAGRVQSITLRLVVEREREIEAFKVEEYWSIEASLRKNREDNEFKARLIELDSNKLDKLAIKTQEGADQIVNRLKNEVFRVSQVTEKDVKRNPSPPFTTSTLQQEASRKLGYSAKQTMMAAQRLYETGLITYMRTDSVYMAQSAVNQANKVIIDLFGTKYALENGRHFKNKSKGAQEAHEAIRPTNLARVPEDVKALEVAQRKVYSLIWKRAIASQMESALVGQTSVDIKAGPGLFRANGQVIRFDGFIRVYMEGQDDKQSTTDNNDLPILKEGEILDLNKLEPLQHFTEPPPRYSDATLVKALEEHGIGRPSTYAPTLATIQDRGYVEKIEKKYHPSEVGFLVNDLLVEHFPKVVDIDFTAKMEADLDDIAEEGKDWVPLLKEFYGPFHKNVIEKEETVGKIIEESNTPCPDCGKHMMIKFGRLGKYLTCPNPDSKTTQPMPEEAAKIKELEEKTKDEKCPLCDKAMTVKKGRFSFFLGCSDYPNCKGIAKIYNKTGYLCPLCKEQGREPRGEIVEKKSRGRGKSFYACTKYPDCNFIINVIPENDTQLMELFEKFKADPPKKKAKPQKKT